MGGECRWRQAKKLPLAALRHIPALAVTFTVDQGRAWARARSAPFKDEGEMTNQDRRCGQDEAGRYPSKSPALGSGRAGYLRCHVSMRKSAAVLAAWIDSRAIRASTRA